MIALHPEVDAAAARALVREVVHREGARCIPDLHWRLVVYLRVHRDRHLCLGLLDLGLVEFHGHPGRFLLAALLPGQVKFAASELDVIISSHLARLSICWPGPIRFLLIGRWRDHYEVADWFVAFDRDRGGVMKYLPFACDFCRRGDQFAIQTASLKLRLRSQRGLGGVHDLDGRLALLTIGCFRPERERFADIACSFELVLKAQS